MPREPPTLPRVYLFYPRILSALSLSSLHPFPSVKSFPVKSGGQLTVRIRTRSACIIYFQRALPSQTAETSGLEHGLPARPFQIHLSELRVTCCAFVPPPPFWRGTNNNSRLTDLSRCSITDPFLTLLWENTRWRVSDPFSGSRMKRCC